MAGNEIAYCVKCRKKQKMTNSHTVKMKKNRYAIKGECIKCHTKMNKFIANPGNATGTQKQNHKRRKHTRRKR
jgi:hypothetical protein